MKIREYISKSDFKVARSCPAKLYYKKLGYPSDVEADEYMKFLAEGGYVVGKLARLLRSGGIEIKTEHGYDQAVADTIELLKRDEVTLYEAAVYSKHKLIRADILEKKGNLLNLIEVKSKSWDSGSEKPPSGMREYLEDVAFQAMVLAEVFPEAEIHSFLYLPDKAKRTKIEGLAGWFKKVKAESLPDGSKRFPRVGVEFIHPEDSAQHRELIEDNLLTLVDVDREVKEMMPGLAEDAKTFIAGVLGGVKKIETPLSKECFKCEYRAGGEDKRDGFRECWGKLAGVEPHVSELYHAGTIGTRDDPLANRLIKQKKVSLYDVPLNELGGGSQGERQRIQIEYTRKNSEWVSDELGAALDAWEYPLQFIDFETSIPTIPFHAGMRPYELIAFQWSCHTIDSPGAEPRHSEWINLDPGFPNFRFASSLMERLGNRGTPLMWAAHENTVLKTVLEQMELFGHCDPELKEWLEQMTCDKKQGRPGRLVDMNQLTLKHYFHPEMKGKTSLKKVLPAIWKNNSGLRQVKWFEKYERYQSGVLCSPYDALACLIEALEQTEVVTEGTGAMRAYYEIMFGEFREDPKVKKNWRDLLLQYCEVDTMAMVIVWTHWRNMTA